MDKMTNDDLEARQIPNPLSPKPSEAIPFFLKTDRKSKHIQIIVLLATLHFALNFLKNPAIMWFYLLELFIVGYYTLTLPLNKSIVPIFYLLFIEGQGRVVWNYNPVMRIIFDAICGLAILKSFATHRKIISNKLPTFFVAAIYLHFIWYGVQLFNINNVGFFNVLAASKVYIFPFLFFLSLLLNPFKENENDLKNLQLIAIALTFAECILSWYQMSERETGLISMASYYRQTMKGDAFVAHLFRPFGTSFLPGAISSYLWLTVGVILLPYWRGLLPNIVKFITIAISWYAIFLCQVRSGMVKHIAIVLTSIIGLTFVSKVKGLAIATNVILILIVVVFLNLGGIGEKLTSGLDLLNAIDRYSIFTEDFQLGDHRATWDVIVNQMILKISSAPLGLGPGRTGAASGMAQSEIAGDPIFGLKESFGWDNLFVALAIDFGIGMIFYCFVVIGLPIFLSYKAIIMFIKNSEKQYKELPIVTICAISGIIIILGNWAAIGLPYNPESFMYWFWMALGFNFCHSANNSDTGNV